MSSEHRFEVVQRRQKQNSRQHTLKKGGVGKFAIHFALGKDWDSHVDIIVKDQGQEADVVALKVCFYIN